MLLRHLALLVQEATRYSVATRRVGIIFVVVLGLALVAIAVATQAAAPFVLYPFA